MNKIFVGILILVLILLLGGYFFYLKPPKQSQNRFCTQALVTACHVITGECKVFGNSCAVPELWKVKN